MKYRIKELEARVRKAWASFLELFKKELVKQIVAGLVGVLLLLLVFFLRFDQIAEWVQARLEARKTPPRTVYYCGCVKEYNNTDRPLAGVSVVLKDVLGEQARTDSTGRFCFQRKEPYGDQEHTLILSKTGYDKQEFPDIVAPIEAGDTTNLPSLQLKPETAVTSI